MASRRRGAWTAPAPPTGWAARGAPGADPGGSITGARRSGRSGLDSALRIEGDRRRAAPTGRPATCLTETERFMSRANVEVVERFEGAFVRGDMDEVLSLLTPDIVIHEAPSLPYP